MHPQKTQKIDLSKEYPCPCCRRGRLKSIVLTEAFGCDRCQKIFVIQDSGYVLEQLSTTYPYKRAWQWTGQQWNLEHSKFNRSYIPLTLVIMLAFIVALLLLRALQLSAASGTFWQAVMVFALIALLIVLWIACRR